MYGALRLRAEGSQKCLDQSGEFGMKRATHTQSMRLVKRELPILILTGQCRANRHNQVKLDNRELWLTRKSFKTLCDLAAALFRTVTGLCRVDRRTIRVLRNEIKEVFGESRIGNSLIRCGDKNKYGLELPSQHVRRDSSFQELDHSHFSSADVANILRESCPMA